MCQYLAVLRVPIDKGIDTRQDLVAIQVHLDGFPIIELHHLEHVQVYEQSDEGFAVVLLIDLLLVHEVLALVLEVEHAAALRLLVHVVLDEVVVALDFVEVSHGAFSDRWVHVLLTLDNIKVNIRFLRNVERQPVP